MAMGIMVVRPEDGEQVGGGPIRCRIIEDGSHTEHRVALIEVVVPPGPAMPPQHIHHKFGEIFIVMKGRLRFTSGAESVDVETGTCVTVTMGTAHTFSNPFNEPATFMCALTPDLYVEYFRDLGQLPVDEKGLLNPADIGRTMARYDTEVVRITK
jgi:mannose-6-phosphate isomerase-like protein (cupin superfamily)